MVDDGSSDATCEVVRSKDADVPPNGRLRLISYSPNRGKGAAVKEGCLAAEGEYVLYTDADLATPIEEWERLEPALEQGYDLAIGARIWPDGRDMRSSQPRYRRLFGKVYNLIAVLFAVRGFPDTQCGFKAMTREAAHRLFPQQRLTGIVFDTELLYLAKRWDMKVAQVPVSWSNIGGSRMRVTLKQAVRVFLDLLSIRVRRWRDEPAAREAGVEGAARGR